MSNRTHALRTQKDTETRISHSQALIELRREVGLLQATVRNLEGRVKELEARTTDEYHYDAEGHCRPGDEILSVRFTP